MSSIVSSAGVSRTAVPSTYQHAPTACSAGTEVDEAPLRAAAGVGLAVLLSVPLWCGVMLAAWVWLA